jgi:hypothetical protein
MRKDKRRFRFKSPHLTIARGSISNRSQSRCPAIPVSQPTASLSHPALPVNQQREKSAFRLHNASVMDGGARLCRAQTRFRWEKSRLDRVSPNLQRPSLTHYPPLAFSLEPLAFTLPPFPLAGKTRFPPNYFQFCTCVNSVPTPSNSRIHNALRAVKPSFFAKKIIRTVRMRLFQNRAIIAK